MNSRPWVEASRLYAASPEQASRLFPPQFRLYDEKNDIPIRIEGVYGTQQSLRGEQHHLFLDMEEALQNHGRNPGHLSQHVQDRVPFMDDKYIITEPRGGIDFLIASTEGFIPGFQQHHTPDPEYVRQFQQYAAHSIPDAHMSAQEHSADRWRSLHQSLTHQARGKVRMMSYLTADDAHYIAMFDVLRTDADLQIHFFRLDPPPHLQFVSGFETPRKERRNYALL
ncbi:MAG: hypothetical protein ACOCWQ_04950 [Nanoarchaeota archaeon]